MYKKQKLLLVEDQACFALSLKTFLSNYANDIKVVGIAENGKIGSALADKRKPDVILMDGISAVKAIKPAHPDIKIVMLSTYDEDEFVREALLAGASGYLLKDTSPTELIISIRALSTGITLISPDIARDLVRKKYVDHKKENGEHNMRYLDELTKQERETFALLATGYNNDQIAEKLHISLRTVRNRVSTIYSKLDVKDRFEIIQLANRLRPL